MVGGVVGGGRSTQNWGRPCRRLLNRICWLERRDAMAAASRCHMSTLRLQFVSTRGAFSYATFSCLPGCLPACLPVRQFRPKSIIRQRGRQKWNRQRKQKKEWGKWGRKKKEKKRMKPKTKRAKCVMRYFLLIFMFVSWALCVRMSECVCVSVSVKCAEWHIVFQSVASADRWKHLMLAICICLLTPRQPTRRQRAELSGAWPQMHAMRFIGITNGRREKGRGSTQLWQHEVSTDTLRWNVCYKLKKLSFLVCAEKYATNWNCNWKRVIILYIFAITLIEKAS